MKDELSFPTFTHDSIAGYCNGNPLYAQYKNDKKSKYIGTKQMWQELSKLSCDLEITRRALYKTKYILKNLLPYLDGYERLDVEKALAQIEQKDTK